MLCAALVAHCAAPDPLPSWRNGAAKQRILAFVAAVTTAGGTDYVAPADRIAVFDHDGTLWTEQPAYVQLFFAIDRVRALAAQHPEWRERQPFKAALNGDLAGVAASGEAGLVELILATHAGMTTDQFASVVADWLATARHPTLGRRYVELVYQPMLELLAYLRANGFQTWIVSGGGIEFLRVFAEARYGVPPQQVIGSSVKTAYEVRDGRPAIVRLAAMDFVDDKAGKPVGINAFIGKRPIAAFGNSDGDFEMLEWTTAGSGARLGMLVHHDDAARELAYDRLSGVGRLARGLDEAPQRGWTVVSMRDDWAAVYPRAAP
ncbi:MAG: HAD family hydrolase [Deltaproteobacteria bacterium]|nr:HAD family hydrolase [Deltaproteobacteria bacterium]